MKCHEFFRALDESDLDPYEIRYLLRVWRRGQCWEKLQKTSDTTGVSIGKLSGVKKSLIKRGWLAPVEVDGKLAFEVAIPGVVDIQDMKSNVAEFHEVKREFHDMKPNFHVVHALPLIEQNEDHTLNHINGNGPSAHPQRDPELKAASDAAIELAEFWTELTKRQPPAGREEYTRDWIKSFNAIWITCGRDVNAAKAKIQEARRQLIAGGMKILNPAKLPGHVQALVDAELLPMTERMNGNGNGKYVNYKNDPDAREAHNRQLFAEVAAEMESGEWSWQI
jgi:hypothetical protein